jgi:hypothetical protein
MIQEETKVKQIIARLQAALDSSPIDLCLLKDVLVVLFEHLSSPKGRTEDNCRAVDMLFTTDDRWVQAALPTDFHDVFAHMPEALHDSVSSPEIADNFGCSPEQLLAKARRLDTEPASRPDR